MKKAAAVVAAVLVSLLLGGCAFDFSFGAKVRGSGVKATEERDLDPFSYVELLGAPEVRITVGEPQSLVIEGDDNVLEVIETAVRGDTLKIRPRESYSSRIGVAIAISVPELEGIEVTGSGDVFVEGVDAEDFDVQVTGSGDVTVRGRAARVEAAVTGSGDIDLFDLEAVEGRASITGSGDIMIHATEKLTAKIMGSGDIEYRGSPKDVKRTTMGSGNISGT